jgi:hypothetical protein
VFPLLDSAILMLEERVTRFERGYKNYLFISTAYGLLLSQECPEQSDNQKYEAIVRATRLYCKILTTTGELYSSKLENEPIQVLLLIRVSSCPFSEKHRRPESESES